MNNNNSNIADICDDLFLNLLKEKNLTLDDVARFSYDQAHGLEQAFESLLKENNIDLSFQSGPYSSLIGRFISGNRGAIASDYVRGAIYCGWEPIEMSKENMTAYFKEYPNCKVYMEDKYGFSNEISHERAVNCKFGTETQSMGYGSGYSSVITTTNLARSINNNDLRIERTSITWD